MDTPEAQSTPSSAGTNPIVNVFLSPGAAMSELVGRPRFAAALLLTTITSLALTAVGNQRGVIEQTVRRQIESSPRMEQVPPDQQASVIERGARVVAVWSWVGAVAGPSFIALLLSGIFLGLGAVLAPARARFRQMFAIVTHAWLPMALNQLISIPVLLAKEPEAVDFQNVLSMANLSFLFSPQEQQRLYSLGSSIDLFSLWVIALLTIGLARLTGAGKGRALIMVMLPWSLYVVIFKILLR